MTARGQALLFVLMLAGSVGSSATHAQVIDQQVLARQIGSEDPAERGKALATVERLAPREVGPELRAALAAALEQEARLHSERFEAGRRRETPKPLPSPEMLSSLSRIVVELRDPATIRALAAALFTGALVPRALANFGEQAAPAVLQVINNPVGWYDAVDGGLIALRFMVEERDTRPLSPGTLTQIRRAAEQRLMGRQYFTTLWRAIDLAVALDDPGLRRIVESLAINPNEVAARGLEDAELIEKTQQRAVDRLAGIPALPRP